LTGYGEKVSLAYSAWQNKVAGNEEKEAKRDHAGMKEKELHLSSIRI